MLYTCFFTLYTHAKGAYETSKRGLSNFHLARFENWTIIQKERNKKTGGGRVGSGWKVKLRKKWKIRKIVVRFEPRTLAAGQATPNYFAYTSPVKIPGSSLSWTTPSPAQSTPICHPHTNTPPPRFRLLSSPLAFSTIYVIFLAKVYRPSPRIFLSRTADIEKITRKEMQNEISLDSNFWIQERNWVVIHDIIIRRSAFLFSSFSFSSLSKDALICSNRSTRPFSPPNRG